MSKHTLQLDTDNWKDEVEGGRPGPGGFRALRPRRMSRRIAAGRRGARRFHGRAKVAR